jgi:hypothetical protein
MPADRREQGPTTIAIAVIGRDAHAACDEHRGQLKPNRNSPVRD